MDIDEMIRIICQAGYLVEKDLEEGCGWTDASRFINFFMWRHKDERDGGSGLPMENSEGIPLALRSLLWAASTDRPDHWPSVASRFPLRVPLRLF